MAAVDFTELTEGGSDSDLSVYATASVSPTANRLLGLSIVWRDSSGGSLQSVTGNGLTWVQVSNADEGSRHCAEYRSMGAAPSSGAISINFSQFQLACQWSLKESDADVDTSGSNGAGAIGSIGTPVTDGALTDGSALTVTIAAFADAGNTTVSVPCGDDAVTSIAHESMTELEDDDRTAETHLASAYKTSEDTSVVSTFTMSSTGRAMAMAYEVKAAAGGGGTILPQMMQHHGA